MIARILIVAACLSLVAAEAAERLVHLKGGRFFNATVVKSTRDSVTLHGTKKDGEVVTITLPAEEFDDYFFYSVRDRAIGHDAKERIHLAKWCVQHEMYSRAKAQMDQARAADETVVEEFMKTEFPKIKEGLAERLLKAGQRALRRGSTKNAKRYASMVLTKFEGTKSDPGAEKLLDDVQKVLDAAEAKRRANTRRVEANKEKEAARREAEARENLLGPVEKLLDEGARHNTLGLKAKNLSQTKTGFEVAAKRYVRAMKTAEASLEGNPDEQTATGLKDMRDQGRQGAISAYLNLAHSYSSRQSFVKANKYTNMALALDPKNQEALSTRADVSTAGGGWSRRWGGRPGGAPGRGR